MSGFDVLTDCQKGCVKPVMKGIGCADSDFKCFCSKDVPSDVGLQMVTCMVTKCLLDSTGEPIVHTFPLRTTLVFVRGRY